MDLLTAEQIAKSVRARISRYCYKTEIVGSVRRRKKEVKDIELLALPLTQTINPGLWAGEGKNARDENFIMQAKQLGKLQKGNMRTGRYCQFYVQDKDVNIDLFMPLPESWGAQMVIRTGPKEFSQYLVHNIAKNVGVRHEGGRVIYNNEIQHINDEKDYFHLLGLGYIHPSKRREWVEKRTSETPY
jgi:DNA polymerase/3'-5' exonuclease PolX